jgi:CRP-like cAMP-binding protein
MIPPQQGKIVEESTDGTNCIGIVEFSGKRRPVYLNLVPDAHIGDCVKFQAGFATERVEDCPEASDSSAEPDSFPDTSAVESYSLLCGLDPAQLRKLLPLALEESFASGEIVFHSGQRSLYLHLIVSGEIALEDDSCRPPLHIQTLIAGDALGWSALTREAQTHFQARAITPVSTLAFDGAQMRAACDRDPVMGYALMKRLLETVTDRLDKLRAKLVPAAAS